MNQQIWILLFHHNGTVPYLVRCFSHIYGGFPAMFADTEAWGSKWPATIPQNWSPGVSMSLRFHHPGWLLHHGWQQHQGAPWAFEMRSEILHHLVKSGANYPFCKGLSLTLWWPNCGWGWGWNFSIVLAFRWIWFSPFSILYSIVQSNDSLPDWCPLVFQHFAMDNHHVYLLNHL